MDLISHEWEPVGTRCNCRCHGIVVLDEGALKAFLNCPPRYDQSMAWAEACGKCEVEHWISATVHDHVTSMEADMHDDNNVWLINHPRKG